jgi:hypothetical protein
MSDLSIKGAAFQSVPADVNRMLEQGRLSPDELEARLTPDDLRILREEILPGRWYPIETYKRLLGLLVELEGGPRPERYLIKRGVNAAKRILAMGIYNHLEAARRAVERSPSDWCAQVGRVMITLSNAMFNFSEWKFLAHQDQSHPFSIHVSDAEAIPDTTRVLLQGFIEHAFNQFADAQTRVTSSRPTAESIEYQGVREG